MSGKNTYFCGGRCVCAAEFQGGIFCICLLGVTGGLFFGLDCPFLASRISIAIPIVGAVMWILAVGALLQTFLIDPGIIPRPSQEEIVETERLYEQDHPNETRDSISGTTVRFLEVDIRGRRFKLTYCRTCKMYRPPRTSHCSRCDNCIERFDHHCKLVGNCVGKRNYRYFYTFITFTTMLSCYVIACNITVIATRVKDMTLIDALKDSFSSIIEAIICLFSLATVGGLACYHTQLLVAGITTNEDLKGLFKSKRSQNNINPYDRGYVGNCLHMFCSSRTPSLLASSKFETESDPTTLA